MNKKDSNMLKILVKPRYVDEKILLPEAAEQGHDIRDRIRMFEHEERDFGRSVFQRTTDARDLDSARSYPTSQPKKGESE